ncbi:MAG: tetratricopeptide repeat protein [Chloroflexi bacterium]|nr:tetratricopeptide repeat protein [Chloroflexota bacterium]
MVLFAEVDGSRSVSSISEYLECVTSIRSQLSGGEFGSGQLAYRGQEDHSWELVSSAERRLKKGRFGVNDVPNEAFVKYHEDLLNKCRLSKFDQFDVEQLKDLELLAALQHYRAATCLIDFTRSALIALWFACENYSVDGKVFVLDTGDSTRFREITSDDIENYSISDILRFATRDTDRGRLSPSTGIDLISQLEHGPRFWRWSPGKLNERIPAQHSMFVFGPVSSERPSTREIVILADYKEQIRQELRELHDVSEDSLFPDFAGFAYTHRHDAAYTDNSASDHMRIGTEMAQQGDYSQAIHHFNAAIDIEPNNWRSHLKRGDALYESDEFSLAIEDYSRAIELDCDDSLKRSKRGMAYGMQGDFNDALEDINRALDLNPVDTGNHLVRATLFLQVGDVPSAMLDIGKFLETAPDNATAYLTLASAHEQLGDNRSTIEALCKAIEIDERLARAYSWRGRIYLSEDKLDSALDDFSKAIELDPEDIWSIRMRARVNFLQSNFEGAIVDYTEAMRLDPELAEQDYGHRGVTQMCLRRWEQASADFETAKLMGLDVPAFFKERYGALSAFEHKLKIKVPQYVAACLAA